MYNKSRKCEQNNAYINSRIIPVDSTGMASINIEAITRLFNLYSDVLSYRLIYDKLGYDATIFIHIDHKDHEATEKSIRFTGNLNEPIIVAKILLFLSENYLKICVSKTDFDKKYTKFLAWYFEKEKIGTKKSEKSQKNDIINHPEHYTKGGIEVREFIDSWKLDFNSGNVIKYVVRAPYKGTELQDLKKAQNYLNHLIELKEKEEANK